MSYNILLFFFFLSLSLSLDYLFFPFPSLLCLLVLFPPSLLLLLATAGSLLDHSCCQLSFISPSSSIYKSSFPNHSLSLDVLRVLSFFGVFFFFFFLVGGGFYFFWGSLHLNFSSFLLLLGTLFSVLVCVM